jgi:type IV fimbrial biogenesis protein FimT
MAAKNWRKGFTLVEMMVTISVLAIVGSIAIPSLGRLQDRGRAQSYIRALAGDITLARIRATSGEQLTPGVNSRSGGLRVDTERSYQVYLTDTTDGTSAAPAVIRVVEIPEEINVTITSPAPGESVRFRSNGTLVFGSPAEIQVHDAAENKTYRLEISLTGTVRIVN